VVPSGGQGSVSTSMLAENLLAELSQSSSNPHSHLPTSLSWIKKEDIETVSQKPSENTSSELNIGMTAEQFLASCKGLCE